MKRKLVICPNFVCCVGTDRYVCEHIKPHHPIEFPIDGGIESCMTHPCKEPLYLRSYKPGGNGATCIKIK